MLDATAMAAAVRDGTTTAEERLALEQADTLEQEANRHERPTV